MSDDIYAKLDNRIVYSSIWEEDGDTCKVWITFLALKNPHTGIVDKNITGIARICKIPIEKVEEAVRKFEAPDPRSSSKAHEGRKLLPVERGWLVVNNDLYMGLGWSDEKKEYERRRKAEYRSRKPGVTAPEPEPEKPVAAKKTNPPEDDDSDIIEAIYEAYPKKTKKPDAIRAIAKAIKSFDYEFVLERTKAYAVARVGQNPGYTPHPATFFNAHQFNDDPSTWKDAEQSRPSTTVDRNAGTSNDNEWSKHAYDNVGKVKC